MHVVEEVVIELGQVEHALQDGVPMFDIMYMKQVLPMLLRPTSPIVFDLKISSSYCLLCLIIVSFSSGICRKYCLPSSLKGVLLLSDTFLISDWAITGV